MAHRVQSNSMQSIINFILEIEKLKGVTRKTRPRGLDRHENSAEHSWQLAMLALSLASYAESAIDINRVIGMILVHDIGEIDTGDTMGVCRRRMGRAQGGRGGSGVKRIFGMLPENQGASFRELWQEFERGVKLRKLAFAHAVDRAMPVLLNLANNGQSWRENGISYERVVRRIAPSDQSGWSALWDYLETAAGRSSTKGFLRGLNRPSSPAGRLFNSPTDPPVAPRTRSLRGDFCHGAICFVPVWNKRVCGKGAYLRIRDHAETCALAHVGT